MLTHINIMKYLVKKPVDELLLLYHLPTELYYYHHIYKINDVRKEIIIINNDEIEIFRLYIEIIGSKSYKHVGWVVNESLHQCMICHNDLNILQRKHHCRICGNIICHQRTCMNKNCYVKDMTEVGIQIICKLCKPIHVSNKFIYIIIIYIINTVYYNNNNHIFI